MASAGDSQEQIQPLNDIQEEEEEEEEGEPPLDLRRRKAQRQPIYGWICQPPEEKAGAGILIRNLSKPNSNGGDRDRDRDHDHDEDCDVDGDDENDDDEYDDDNRSNNSTIEIPNHEIGPQLGDTVKIHYEAFLFKDDGSNTLEDKPFDSSRKRNLPFCFCIGKEEVIEGLDIAVEQMALGQLVEVTIPYLYAYGEQGYPPQVPPKSTLVFHVELLDFTSGDVTGRKWQK